MSSVDIIQGLLGVLGISSVIVGGYIGFVKLRPDMNSAAVDQAMEAMKGMKMLKDEVALERDEYRERAIIAERRLDELGITREAT